MSEVHVIAAEPDCRATLDPFWERLQQAVSWCTARLDMNDVAGCLRTEHLRPPILHRNYFDAVGLVLAWRQTALGPVTPTQSLRGGRLLLYFPDAELADGAAEVESQGFFDVNNSPPWDTWVGIFTDEAPESDSYATYLLSWVPPELIPLAQRGIAVNPEECIAWLDDRAVGMQHLLRELSN
jgi:hypothetical protein